MNTSFRLLRDVTCGAAATLITLVLGATFVQSTSVAPGTHVDSGRISAVQTTHAWLASLSGRFGRLVC